MAAASHAPALARFLRSLDDQAGDRFIDQLARLVTCLRDEAWTQSKDN